ncbi:hypothetical protein EYD10_17969 [Varanus komodoensis]|nr:hypothetical protein EYD10_17969 [Varanus komodoensis]
MKMSGLSGQQYILSSFPPLLQIHSFLRSTCFNNSAGEEIYFENNGELSGGYDLINLVTFPNGSFHRVLVGRVDRGATAEDGFNLNGSAIVWNHKFNQVGRLILIVSSFHRVTVGSVKPQDTLEDGINLNGSAIVWNQKFNQTPCIPCASDLSFMFPVASLQEELHAAPGSWESFIRVMSKVLYKVPESARSVRSLVTKNFQHALAFACAIDEINTDAQLLPNITLGFMIKDDIFDSKETTWKLLQILCNGQVAPPNYICASEEKLMAVIGGLTSPNSMQGAHILNSYKIPQFSYGSFDPVLRDKSRFPAFYQMVPREDLQYAGIVQLLIHFGWTWIGFLVSDDESGETFLRALRPRLLQSKICLAWTQVIPLMSAFSSAETYEDKMRPMESTLLLSEISVFLVYGDNQSMEGLRIMLYRNEILHLRPLEKVWITTAEWDMTAVHFGEKFTSKSFHGALSFRLHSNVVPGFQDFLETLNPYQLNSSVINFFWFTAFQCLFPEENFYPRNLEMCTGKEKLGSLPGSVFEMGMSGQSYNVYNAAYLVAHSLHAIDLVRAKHNPRTDRPRWEISQIKPWQLHPFLRSTHFNNGAGEEIFLDGNGELSGGHDLINLVTFPNGSFHRVLVGRVDRGATAEDGFNLNGSAIVWNQKFNQVGRLILIVIIVIIDCMAIMCIIFTFVAIINSTALTRIEFWYPGCSLSISEQSRPNDNVPIETECE